MAAAAAAATAVCNVGHVDDSGVLVPAMRAGAAAYKRGDIDEAIAKYRTAVHAVPSHPHACILLASALQAVPAASGLEQALRDAESDMHAACALSNVHVLPQSDLAQFHARYGYYKILRAHRHPDDDAEASDSTTPTSGDLADAVQHLRAATRLQPTHVLAWRNLSTAYRLCGQHEKALEASERALMLVGDAVSPDLLYRHAKALRRVGRYEDAATCLCNLLDRFHEHEMAVFWIRVMLADTRERAQLRPATVARMSEALVRRGAPGATAVAVPHDYVRKLFDGYAKKFDEHLTVHLQYATPRALLQLALSSATTDSDAVRWQACADLGCGTGLAGVEFRPHVAYLAGVDLSGGMVAEARARGIYDELAVAEVGAWALDVVARPDGHVRAFDCAVCADVLVYIGALEALFGQVSGMLLPGGLFVASTEALTAPTDAGFALTGTGRCQHDPAYVIRCAAAAGIELRRTVRQPIRKNAGDDVIGDLFVFVKK